jgi:threonine synthase
MFYVSTRGGLEPTGFSDILLGGLAPDGGLVMPQSYPQISFAQLQAWRELSYAQLAYEIIRLYATDIPGEDLQGLVAAAYTAENFGNPAITPLKPLGEGMSLLALSNGPTLAFKDMAMQLLGQLFEYTLAKRSQQLNILGATSGDTGSAAEYAMRGKRGVRVIMLSPAGRMSPFQQAQMFSLPDRNIVNVAVQGVFDDCQDMVKAISNDLAFKQRYNIGTVNSINWARVVAQVVYYFKGYFAATSHSEQQVSFAVPSGNFGNVLAGHIARMMGLPIAQLVVATNENNVLDEFFKTGVYRVRAAAQTHETSSPSMDISKASNFERFVFDLLDRDAGTIATLWHQVDKAGGFDLSGSSAFKKLPGYGFLSGTSTHQNRLATIADVYKQHGTIIDPHTADGVFVARQYQKTGEPMVVLETALPIKFSATIEQALGKPPGRPIGFEGLEAKARRYVWMPASVPLLRELIEQRCSEAL